MAHGCLRWADLQASRDLKLTKDAVFGVSWRMKGKKLHVPWAALRVGFTGQDWGAAWMSELAAAGLPGGDFVLKAPASTWTVFADRIAVFADGQAAMRTLLAKSGMTVETAMTFSCHSWRHFYPTAGAQLDVHPEAVDTMGHWTPGTGMAALYDGKACVSELLNKAKVVKAVAEGWDLAEPGCLPVPATPRPMQAASSSTMTQSGRAATTSSARTRGVRKKGEAPKMMVLQTRRLKIHGYTDGVYSLCRQWKCGTPDEPTMDAMFTDKLNESTAHMTICKSCELQQGCVFKPTSASPSEKDDDSSSSSSSSCSS